MTILLTGLPGDKALRGAAADPAHGRAPELRLRKIGSATTARRELQALRGMRSMPAGLVAQLLRPECANAPRRGPLEVSAAKRWEKRQRHIDRLARESRLDEEQLRALTHTAEMVHRAEHGFALVQGPPGTGKSTL